MPSRKESSLDRSSTSRPKRTINRAETQEPPQLKIVDETKGKIDALAGVSRRYVRIVNVLSGKLLESEPGTGNYAPFTFISEQEKAQLEKATDALHGAINLMHGHFSETAEGAGVAELLELVAKQFDDIDWMLHNRLME